MSSYNDIVEKTIKTLKESISDIDNLKDRQTDDAYDYGYDDELRAGCT